jgi:hypothetical protein
MSDAELGQTNHIIEIRLDNDLYNYITFLEKIRRINRKEDAILAALRIFKKLNMQDWFPNIYRVGQERVVIVSQGMLNDLLSTMSDSKLKKVAKVIAINRVTLDTYDHRLDLEDETNWGVILKELENFGWGKFSRRRGNIVIRQLALPITFVKIYLETLFKTKFLIEPSRDKQIIVLKHTRA